MMKSGLAGAVALSIAAVAVLSIFLLLPEPPAPTPQRATADAAEATASLHSTRDLSPNRPIAPQAPFAPAERINAVLTEDEWVERLDSLLGAEDDNAQTARKLIAALSTLPPDAQEEYVAHAVNLCDDEDFGQLETVYLATGTPPAVVEIIFDDALNRPDELKLPMLAKTLRNPSHPMAGEAREILEMYLDLEPGATPATGWEAGVQGYLRDEAQNP